MKLEGLKVQKLTKLNFSEKFSLWEPINSSKIWSFGFRQKFNPWMCLFSPQEWCITENCMSGKNVVLQFWCKMLSTNRFAVFFYHQYLCKESISTIDFLHGDNHHKKVASEIITFGWVWPVLSLVQLDYRIPIFRKNQILIF